MKSGAEQVRDALSAWLERNGDAVLVGESVGRGGGNAGTTAGLFERFGADRVLDTPIADRTSFGLALGLALGGRPVAVELSSSRALLAVAEMLADAGRFASTAFRPALTVRVPIGGEAGEAIDPPAAELLDALPGVRVVCITAGTARSVLGAVLGSGVTVVLEPRAELAARREAVDAAADRARVVRDGSHATVLAWGSAVAAATSAAEALQSDGIEVRVLDLVCLSPVDPAVARHVIDTGRVVAAHPADSGLARRLLRVALDEAFLFLESPPGDCSADPEAVKQAVRDSVLY
ncbi:MAG: transketolase C-terminal domain-containing protein [Myxococcota bacterium]